MTAFGHNGALRFRTGLVWILIRMIDVTGVKRGRSTFYAINDVSFVEQEFCKAYAILTSGGNQSHAHCRGCCVTDRGALDHRNLTYTRVVEPSHWPSQSRAAHGPNHLAHAAGYNFRLPHQIGEAFVPDEPGRSTS